MNIFRFHFDHEIYMVLIASFLWALNFRATFKNNSDSMGLGSCWVLRFDPILILSKNAICILFLGIFIYEIKLSKGKKIGEKQIIQKQEGNQVKMEVTDLIINNETILDAVDKAKNLEKPHEKFLFWLKVVLLIIVIYIIEELYFMLSNNHVLDRVICPIRNFSILLALFIFSPLILKKPCSYNRHQLFPFIIIFILSVLLILFNIFGVDRFLKKFKPVNSSIYYVTYFLMGLELVLIKYLVDSQFISIFLILGLKGLIGTIIFIVISAKYNAKEFFNIADNILTFEYDNMFEEFEVIYKIIYVITLVILQWLIVYIINKFSENHIQMILMMTDLIYFPFYCIERFAIQNFTIFRFDSFLLNAIIGALNTFFMLIFNEILECNFLGLNKDLKRNINKRQDIDYDNKLLDENTSDSNSDSVSKSSREESLGSERELENKIENE